MADGTKVQTLKDFRREAKGRCGDVAPGTARLIEKLANVARSCRTDEPVDRWEVALYNTIIFRCNQHKTRAER